jgi:hypothetical protein
LRIVPLASEVNPLSFYGPFMLCDLGSTQNAFMYLEGDQTDEAVRDGAKIDQHRRAFERAWLAAPDEAASRDLIESFITRLQSGGS